MIPKYKDIMDLVKKGATLEAQEKIIELREAAIELQDENHELKEEIKRLEEKLRLKELIIWEKPHYWHGEGEQREGPFCQKCYDANEKQIRLQGGKNDTWVCYECESTFHGPNYNPPKSPRTRSPRNW